MNKLIDFVWLSMMIGVSVSKGIQMERGNTHSISIEIADNDRSPFDEQRTLKLEKSWVFWRGTKMLGMGKHEGLLPIKRGKLNYREGKLIGGDIVADVENLKITDIPPHETIPIRNLTNHLQSDFETVLFPTAKFEISDVKTMNGDSLEIKGKLTIKDISREMIIMAEKNCMDEDEIQYLAEFSFDRFLWNIGSAGSWLEKKTVDAEIYVKVELWVSLN